MADRQGADFDYAAEGTQPRSGLRLPGFVNDEDIGFGDLVKRVSGTAGIRPCRGCERRAEVLNRWVVISGRRNRKR
ncbi:hypothetical protein ACWCPQ_17210 [Nocardia sp. NPDC001965]